MESLKFYTIEKEDIGIIKTLWEHLNKHHEIKSTYFSNYFKNLTFEDRVSLLLEEKKLTSRIEVVESQENGEVIGYCLSTIDGKKRGLVESIYVEPLHRGLKIGDRLIKNALQWLEDNEVYSKSIYVVYGNEEIFDFYAKYGFRPKTSTLEIPD